jgi:hypothetical protein
VIEEICFQAYIGLAGMVAAALLLVVLPLVERQKKLDEERAGGKP